MILPEPNRAEGSVELFSRPHIEEEDFAEIASLFGARCLERWPVTGGMPNVTFKAYTSNGALAVRVCNVGYTTRQHLDFELEVLRYLESVGFKKCPRIVPGRDGNEIQWWRHYPVIAMRFVDGERLETLSLNSSLVTAAGQTVGELTLALGGMRPVLRLMESYQYRSQRLLKHMRSVVGAIGWPVDLDFIDYMWERESEVLIGGRLLAELVVSHTDVWPPNMIVTDRGVILVDFDDVALAPPTLDLASALSEFAVDDLGAADMRRMSAMLKGYINDESLPLTAKDLDEVVAGICCSYVTWLACDASHGLKFQESGHYYSRLKRLADQDVYLELRSRLELAMTEVSGLD